MKRIFLYFFIAVNFCMFSQNIQQNQKSVLQNENAYSNGEFIVLLKSEAINRADLNSTRTEKSVIGIQAFDELSKDFNVTSVELCFSQNFRFPRKAITSKLDRYVIVKVSDNTDLELIMKQYQNLSEVELVEPNYTVKAHTTPNDPLYNEQWGLKNTSNAKEFGTSNLVGIPGSDINIEPAWNLHTGVSNPVTIAILDTGVDYNHPEFSGRMLPGYDFMNNNNDPMDEDYDGHGTSCAGIAAAAGNNGIGVAGVNWGADILPVKVLDNGSGTNTAVANGLIFAVDNGADVISMSLGSSSPSTLIENAALYAYNADVLVFASRGNDNNAFDNYPSSYSTVISVGGLSPCDTRKTPNSCDGESWWGASYGGGPDKMDFVAPAARITTTDITGFGGYSSNEYTDSFNGTSSACPYAAGVGALIRSYNPSLNVDEIRNIMRTTAADIGAVGYDDETGYGKIDAEAALLAAIPYDFWFETQDVADFDTCNSNDIATIDFDFFRLPTAGNEAVTLSIIGAPSGLASLFTPQTITNQTTFNLSLSGISSLSAGSYNFTISGQSTSFTYDLPVTLNVFDSLTQNVNLTFPADNQNSIAIPFVFQWQTISNANAYQIQIATDIGFTTIIEDSTIFEAQYTSSNVTEGNQYYWRVKPINTCGEGSFSSIFGFITACNNTATLGLNFATTSELNLDILNSNASAWEIEAVPAGTAPIG